MQIITWFLTLKCCSHSNWFQSLTISFQIQWIWPQNVASNTSRSWLWDFVIYRALSRSTNHIWSWVSGEEPSKRRHRTVRVQEIQTFYKSLKLKCCSLTILYLLRHYVSRWEMSILEDSSKEHWEIARFCYKNYWKRNSVRKMLWNEKKKRNNGEYDWCSWNDSQWRRMRRNSQVSNRWMFMFDGSENSLDFLLVTLSLPGLLTSSHISLKEQKWTNCNFWVSIWTLFS